MKCLLAYVKHLKDSYLHNEKAHTMLLENLSNSFEHHRDSFYNADIPTHSRVPEIVAWLMIGIGFVSKPPTSLIKSSKQFAVFTTARKGFYGEKICKLCLEQLSYRQKKK